MMAQRVQSKNALAVAEVVASMGESPGSDAAMSAKVLRLPDSTTMMVDELTARMAAGDEDAFSLFHDRYCDRLFRYLIVLCRGDEPLACDLLQITMLKVVRSIRQFSDEAAFWNWLAAIARNNFLDHVRKSRRRPQLEPILENSSATTNEGDTDKALATALEDALAQLPNEERLLIESFYFESGSYNSLATQRETSPKAIESRLGRIRQKLRHAILKYLHYENS
jgi:RNA polymerase sigma factor (sigma-70 family)